MHVKFLEHRLWEALFMEASLFSQIGRAGCLTLDFPYNMGGSEAIAETFFHVMESQRKDNLSPEMLDMRTLISFCLPGLPEASQCPESTSNIAAIFRKGISEE